MSAFTALFWLLILVSLNRSGESAANETRLKIPRPAMNTRWIQKPVKEIKSCLSPDLEDEERKTCRFYAAVIDAGSTGTRLHLFEFSHDTNHEHSPFKVEKEVYKKIKPGLSSFASEPENAAVSIRGLISAARKVVPVHLWSHTPIVMKATAGLRLLPGDQADGILKEVEAEIQKSGLLMDDESVGILSGTDEGAYGWFTLNFLTDKLRYLKRNVKKTSVALDLGGGSTQITFIPENPSRVFTQQTPEKDFGHTLKVFGNEIRLFTHSYLGNGLVASRLGIGRLLATEQSDKQHKMITHCFPANYTLKDWDYAGNAWTISATPESGYANCLKSTKRYVKKMNVQRVAEIDEREIHAFAYFYERAEQAGLLKESDDKGKWIRVGDFADVARHVCSLPVTEIGTEDWRPWQCLDLCYIYSLLHDGYGLNDDKLIHLTKKVRGYECSWALGAGYHLLNSLNRLSDTQTIRISGLVEKDAQIPSLMCKSEHGEIVTAIAFQSSGPGQCRWSDYYLDCPFSLSANRIAIYSGEPGANQINMTVTPPVERHYPLVVCYSRMFYFENWQIALASLELYRHFGVSLFNIPIISVISDLYKIFKSYESEGLVRFGHGVVMPKKMKGLNYNPNSEVEFFNQVISNSECLFEYRDHSDFMLFVDVDDILIPRLTNSLINEVLYHQKLHPLGGAFEFLWSRSSVVQLDRTPEEFSIKRMMEHVYINDTMPNVGKSIVVSKRMNLGVMHHALQSEDIVEGYSSILMTEDDMLAIHLRNQVFNGEQEWTHPDNRYFAHQTFKTAYVKFQQHIRSDINVHKAFKELPEERYYYNLMVDCYNDEKQKVREHDLTNCPNPLHCKPKINAKNPGPECVVLKSTYQHVQPVGSFHIYAPEHKWLSNEKNCLF